MESIFVKRLFISWINSLASKETVVRQQWLNDKQKFGSKQGWCGAQTKF